MNNVEAIYAQIIFAYHTLTPFQMSVLESITHQLNRLSTSFYNNQLTDFSHGISADSDLLLYRENENGLMNIIIHPEENFACSFIGNTKGRQLKFYEPRTADFEKIALEFLV
jgi:hypothetical protein